MRNWIWLLLVFAPAHAQEKKAVTLTAMDYIEIQQLVNKYGQYIDTCSNNGYDYADLYTPDGVFIDKYSDDGFKHGGVQRAKGRDELAAASWGGSKGCKDMPWNGWTHLMGECGDHADGERCEGAMLSDLAGRKRTGQRGSRWRL